MKFSVLILVLYSSLSVAIEPICDKLNIKHDSDRVPETRFTTEEVLKTFEVLKKYLNDGYAAEEEFLAPQLLFISGGILRNQAETSKTEGGASFELYRKKFCEFWETEAYMEI